MSGARFYQEAMDWLRMHPAIERQIQDEVARLSRLASLALQRPLAPIAIRYDLRGTAAGCASAHQIRLNPVLLRENLEDFLRHTIAHEVAHSAVMQRWPRAAAHGPQWWALMEALGYPATRCHRYDTHHARLRHMTSYPYACRCGVQLLSAIRHRRSLTGPGYRCRRCHQPLRFQTEFDPG